MMDVLKVTIYSVHLKNYHDEDTFGRYFRAANLERAFYWYDVIARRANVTDIDMEMTSMTERKLV